MTKGFTTNSKNKNTLIKQTLKTHRQFKQIGVANYVDCCRTDWNNAYNNRKIEPFNREELFTPGKDVISNNSSKDVWTAETHKALSNFTETSKGYWMLMSNYDANKKDYDFTIQVKAGDLWGFHPSSIRSRLVELFDVETYNQWKRVVLDDLNSLKWCLEQFKTDKDLVWSVCCSPSSERLCKSVGLEVRQGIAFI